MTKLCECGCGQAAPIAEKTNRRAGHVKGQPARFIFGHRGGGHRPLAERLAENSRPDSATGCVLWIGRRIASGYGVLNVGCQETVASRAAWELANGPIPGHLRVCHRCDNPPCINLEHLFLGTDKDNADDMWRKGRGRAAKGERQHSAKLTEAAVREILQSSLSQTELARIHGVSIQAVNYVIHRKNWKHVSVEGIC